MEVTFKPSVDKQRVKGEEINIFDPLGTRHPWVPEFHASVLTSLQSRCSHLVCL